jgi:tRNA (mo5U34)-methyltransferase
VGSVGIFVTINETFIERVRNNFFYRFLIKPVQNWLTHGTSGHGNPALNGTSENHQRVSLIDRNRVENHDQAETFYGSAEEKAIRDRISAHIWYHSINLGHGVITPGAYNHYPYLHEYRLPERLDGMRVLDVATFDGFWAFEFERRGAADIVALDVQSFNDIDLPPLIKEKAYEEDVNWKTGIGFNIAKDILKSKVKRELLNVYDLTPERAGRFDMTFCSDLLLHLMNPMKALQNMRSVVTEYAYIVEPFDPEIDVYPYDDVIRYKGGANKCIWWMFGLKSLEHMIRDAGFRKIELLNTFNLGYRGEKEGLWRAVFKALP